jgi:eukaryotic-like serine/threonine-protein kinase
MPERFVTGDVLVSKFRILRVVGEGGMGTVYEAEHLSLGERVAIKVLHTGGDTGARLTQRLLREARAAARIKSEHVARVNDFGALRDGSPFLVMELVDGPSLARVLRDDGPLSPELALRYTMEICLALAEAHALGIVHRDIKPSNLIIARRRDGSNLLKVLDFGVAKQLAAGASTMTGSSGVLGSPNYMSPEQIRNAHSVDERTDIWSIGVVLYEMLTGRLPFEAFTAPGVLAAISADEPVAPRERRPDLGPALEQVVLRCLAKQREQRQPRVVELAAELSPHVAGGAELVERVRRLRETAHEARPAFASEPSAERAGEASLTQNATATTAADTPSAAPARRSRLRPLLAITTGLVVALLVAAFGVSRQRAPVSASGVPPATPLSPESAEATESALSPAPLVRPVVSASATSSAELLPPAHSASRLQARRQPPASSASVAPSAPAPPPAKSADPLDYGYRK